MGVLVERKQDLDSVSCFRSQLTHIAVHPNVPSIDNSNKYDVIFAGTDDGRVLKFVTLKKKDGTSVRSVLVEAIKMFSDGRPVVNLMVHLPEMDSKNSLDDQKLEMRLIAVSDAEIKALPLHSCQNKTNCGSCGKYGFVLVGSDVRLR